MATWMDGRSPIDGRVAECMPDTADNPDRNPAPSVELERVASSRLQERFSGVILREPLRTSAGVRRGVVVCNEVRHFLREVPGLRERFWLVERWGWRGANRTMGAHVMLVDDIPAQNRWNLVFGGIRRLRRLTPWPIVDTPPIFLPVSNADFIDTDAFAPDGRPKTHDVLMVARWDPFKAHDLLLDAIALLVGRKIGIRGMILGHLAATTPKELRASLAYHARIVGRIRDEQLPIDLPLSDGIALDPADFAKSSMAARINAARVGVILSRIEGLNRFKMECLACDVPVIICSDACWPLRRHVEPETGVQVRRRADALAETILAARERHAFRPRERILAVSGCDRSMRALQETIDRLDAREGHPPSPIGRYDGRNSTLVWNDFVSELRAAVARVSLEGEGDR